MPYDEDRLRKAVGEKSFARGRTYADQGQVILLSASADHVLAAAFGADDYTVSLERRGPDVAGRCTCPAYDDAGHCKHMVATALLANEAAAAGKMPADNERDVVARIAQLDRRSLEKLLLGMAMQDWKLLRSLHFALGLAWDEDLD